MERRTFVTKLIKAGILVVLPSDSIVKALKDAYDRKLDVIPYTMDIHDTEFRERLKIQTLPTAVKTTAINQNSDITSWGVGVGKDANAVQNTIENVHTNRPNGYDVGEPYTPVHIVHANHEVYGQYFQQTTGKKGIIRGFDKNFYVVNPSFCRIFTNEKYACYGLPINHYRVVVCSVCKEQYVYQDFAASAKDTKPSRLYAHAFNCGGNPKLAHDGLKLNPIEPCDCSQDDGIQLGKPY